MDQSAYLQQQQQQQYHNYQYQHHGTGQPYHPQPTPPQQLYTSPQQHFTPPQQQHLTPPQQPPQHLQPQTQTLVPSHQQHAAYMQQSVMPGGAGLAHHPQQMQQPQALHMQGMALGQLPQLPGQQQQQQVGMGQHNQQQPKMLGPQVPVPGVQASGPAQHGQPQQPPQPQSQQPQQPHPHQQHPQQQPQPQSLPQQQPQQQPPPQLGMHMQLTPNTATGVAATARSATNTPVTQPPSANPAPVAAANLHTGNTTTAGNAAAAGPASSPACSRVVFVIESTAAMLQSWPNLRTLYVEPLLRCIDKGSFGRVELAVVLVGAADWTGDQPVDGTSWTTSVSEIRSLLDAIQFVGGGFGPIAIAQALAHVVYLQTLPSSLPVSAPLPGGGSAPPPADPVVPCYCLLIVTSPADHVPVHVPGLNNPAASRPALAQMHTFHSLTRCVRQAYNLHLSVALGYKSDVVHMPARDYIMALLQEHFGFSKENNLNLESIRVTYPSHREYMGLISPAWNTATAALKREVEHAKAQLARQQQAQKAAVAQTAAVKPTTAAVPAAAVNTAYPPAAQGPPGNAAGGQAPGTGGSMYVPQMQGGDAHAAAAHVQPAQQLPQQPAHLPQAPGQPGAVPLAQYPQPGGPAAGVYSNTPGQPGTAASPAPYAYHPSPQYPTAAGPARPAAGPVPGQMPQPLAVKKPVPQAAPAAGLPAKPTPAAMPQQQQQQQRPTMTHTGYPLQGMPGQQQQPQQQQQQQQQQVNPYGHIPGQHPTQVPQQPLQQQQQVYAQQQQQVVAAAPQAPPEAEPPPAVVAPPQAAAAAPQAPLAASTNFIVAVPAQWAARLGIIAKQENYQYPIFQLQLLREGGITLPTQGMPGLVDHLFDGFTKSQYVCMVRTVTAEEMNGLRQMVVAEVRLDVLTVTDYAESVQVFNLIVAESRRTKGTALEVDVAGLQGFKLIIWPAALQSGLAGNASDSRDPIRGWIARR